MNASNEILKRHQLVIAELANLGLADELNSESFVQPDDTAEMLEMMMLDESLPYRLRFQLANLLHCISLH